MLKYLKELRDNKQKEIDNTRALIQSCEDINEARSLSANLDKMYAELNDMNAKISEAEKNDSDKRQFNPANTYNIKRTDANLDEEDKTNSIEYRKAFMNFIVKKTPIPAELRADANTTTTDVATVIPTTIVNQIIEKMEQAGMILNEVSKTAIAGGVVVPTSAVKPVATWVSEGASSDRQKKTTGSISFSHFKLRCEISMTIEVNVMALGVFESRFVENVATAMLIAQEKAILNGNGTSQPKGILKETPAATVTLKAKLDFADLIAVESAVPVEYENTSKWCLTKANFLKLMGMVDSNGQPIARVNYGLGGKVERTILGREAIIVPYATEIGENFGFVYNFKDYLYNTIYDLGISTKDDWDTEDKLAKAVMSVDGKSIDNASLILVKQAAAA